MKRIAVVFFVAVLGLALSVPAFALENQFGGYWRTRMYSDQNFDGVDNDISRDGEVQQVDTRTRLYYTAIINDNLKLVNKFEMNAVWGKEDTEGEADSYGDIGADGISVKVKNTYIDFNYEMFNVKMGAHGGAIQRGFIFDDDFSGVTIGSNGFTGRYMKVEETGDAPGEDSQMYQAQYALGMEGVTITPNFTYADLEDHDYVYFLGVDVDGSADQFSYWGTLIYEGGEEDATGYDVSAFLIAAGAGVDMDALNIHFQAFYATGDDDDTDDEYNEFTGTPGQSYTWSEIMGEGIFDNQASNNSPGTDVTNIMAANVGVGFKVSEQLSIGADIWWAQLAEDDANDEKSLGTEIDLTATYTIVEGLNLDLVAAYLFAGDATTGNVDDDADPIELGAMFSIAF